MVNPTLQQAVAMARAAHRRQQQQHQPPHNSHHQQPHLSPIQQWLAGDDVYQQQLAAYKNNLNNYITTQHQNIDRTNQDFATAQDRMGLQKQRDTQDMEDDFGARGILTSGLFTKSLGQYNTDYGNKLSDLSLDNQRNVGDYNNQIGQERQTYQNQVQLARQQAIQRRAQKLGIA